MRLTENLTSEKSADTSGPRLESLIFYQATRWQNASETHWSDDAIFKTVWHCGTAVTAPA